MTWTKKHHECTACGSSDAACTDSKGKVYCFSCNATTNSTTTTRKTMTKKLVSNPEIWASKKQAWEKLAAKRLPIEDRFISAKAAVKFGIGVKGEDAHVYPYYDDSGLATLKERQPGKNFPTTRRDENVEHAKLHLFGQDAFMDGGKYIIVTEGECDALAAYEMFGCKFPAVSVRSSSTALADVRHNYDYLDSYETVVFMFDPDEAGNKAVQECAAVFAGKSTIASLAPDVGDPCEYLKAGYEVEFKDAFWKAKKYTPSGLIEGVDLWELINEAAPQPLFHLPWPKLDRMFHGIFEAVLYTICAGSGVGKTQIVKALEYHVLATTPLPIGMIHLEEDLARSTRGLMSQHAKLPLHLPETVTSEEVRREAFDATMGSGRVICYDHFGSTGIDDILGRIKYMVRVFGAKVIFLDHLHIMLSNMDQPDERKAIDEVMTKLRICVQELKITLFLVSHLKRPAQGLSHEEGREVSSGDLRGSASIYQLSDGVISAERNGQSSCPIEANTTIMRGLKNRLSGEIGIADSLSYNPLTSCMTPCSIDGNSFAKGAI